MNIKSLVLAILLVTTLTACGSTDSLEGPDWVLISIDGSSPLPGTMITAKFSDGEVSGSAGCNTYGGSYAVSGEKLAFEMLFSTEMACMEPDGVMAQESAYLEKLGSATGFRRESGGRLEIFSADGGSLSFAPQAP